VSALPRHWVLCLTLCTAMMTLSTQKVHHIPHTQVQILTRPLERVWDLTQAINVKGVWFGCKHAIVAMRNVSFTLLLCY
jgi:hypothetical protein